MARATRSATQQETDSASSSVPPTRPKAGSKKRKRQSLADSDGQPNAKQARSDSSIKEEGSQEPEGELEQQDDEAKPTILQGAGDVPINSDDAQKILDILEMVDTQGLLDRVFPLPEKTSESSTSDTPPSSQSYSVRTLLRESSQHPLCVLRSAVRHLLPISSHPRSRPSTPAAQQLRFCNLALSLLDQASFHSAPIPLDRDNLFDPSEPSTTHGQTSGNDSQPSTSVDPPLDLIHKHKYALLQHLPTGDWWTSLNSELALPSADGRELKQLPTAHAELVAIISSSASDSTLAPLPKLGSYAPKRPPALRPKLPGPRILSSGSFLDYGPYASFAPTFDQEGVEVGRDVLGEVLSARAQRKRARDIERVTPGIIEEVAELDVSPMDINRPESGEDDIKGLRKRDKGKEKARDDGIDELDDLFPPDEIAAIKGAMGSLELEEAVQELLDRNRRALQRLVELQKKRLGGDRGGSSAVQVDSEEWETAKGIQDSLTLLASLRPRSSTTPYPPLIPSTSTLRKLHHTLPLAPSQGWHGTLPPSHPSALRDDSTLRVKSTAASRSTLPNHTSTPAPPPAAPVPSYPGYSQSNYASQPYRAGGYATPYKPAQAYSGGYNAQGQGAGSPTPSAPSYYPSQPQYGTPGQQQYSYGSGNQWYGYQNQNTANAGGSNSGRGTPQPATPVAPPSYTGSFNGQPPAQQGRAVANTVLSATANKSFSPATWSAPGPRVGTPGAYAPPTLPPHLRTSGVAAQPIAAGGGYQQPSFYGAYQAAPSAAR